MRPIFTSAFLLLSCASLVHAAESSSTSSKSGSRPPEQTSSAPKTRKVTKEKTVAPSGDKASQSDDERFTAARRAAYEDTKVAELRAKVDSAKNDESANKSMRSYLRALYGKMRSLEPSLEERINMTEAAALRAVPQSQ